jgi:hypothetical protein
MHKRNKRRVMTAGIDAALGRSSHVAAGNEARFSLEVVFDIENEVDLDEQVVTGWRSTFTSVLFEGVIIVDLSHFKVERILPLGVLIGGVNLEGVFTAVRQEDAELITGSIALSLKFVHISGEKNMRERVIFNVGRRVHINVG